MHKEGPSRDTWGPTVCQIDHIPAPALPALPSRWGRRRPLGWEGGPDRTGQGGIDGKQQEEITCVPRPHPRASPFHQPHHREEEESCPRECCLDPWIISFPQLLLHSLASSGGLLRALGKYQSNCRSVHTLAHPKTAPLTARHRCVRRRAGGRLCWWKKQTRPASPGCSTPRWVGAALTESHDSLGSRDEGHLRWSWGSGEWR